MACSKPCRRQRCQHGATLVMTLIVVVLVLLLGLSAMGNADLQFRLASNLQFDNNAMNHAEAALGAAEHWLAQGDNFRHPGFATDRPARTPGLYPPGAQDPVLLAPLATQFGAANAHCVDAGPDCASSYVIQLLSVGNSLPGSSQSVGGRASSACNRVNLYQITGRGTDGRGASRTVASYFSVRSCTPL